MNSRKGSILITLVLCITWLFINPPPIVGDILRVIVILLGFYAMNALYRARSKRLALWSEKTHNIWFVHVTAIFSIISGNIEFLIRDIRPSNAIFIGGLCCIYAAKSTKGWSFYKSSEIDK